MNDLTALALPNVARNLPRNPTLSLVVPAYNEHECIVEALRKIDLAALKIVDCYEAIVVHDGSTGRTYELACALCSVMPLRVIRVSRNFGKEHALGAGLQAAKGQAVVTLDADGQEPVSALPVVFDHWRNGYKMAYSVRAHRRDATVIKQILTKAFYNALNFGTDVAIPADAWDFPLVDRRVVDAIPSLPKRNRFMKGLYGWVGFNSIAVPVELRTRGVDRGWRGSQLLPRPDARPA